MLAPAFLVWNGNGLLNGGAATSPQTVTEVGVHTLDVERLIASERDVISFVIVDPNTLRVNLDTAETTEADIEQFRVIKPLLGDGKIYDIGRNAYPVKQVGRARIVTNGACYVRVQIQRADQTWENIGGVLATGAGVWVAENLAIPHGKQKLRAAVELSPSTITSGEGLDYTLSLVDGAVVSDLLQLEQPDPFEKMLSDSVAVTDMVQVGESQPEITPDLGWFDASVLPAGALATWVDQSTAGTDLTASPSQPVVVAGVQNGLNIVRFDDTKYFYFAVGKTTIRTIFYVIAWNNATQYGGFKHLLGNQNSGGSVHWHAGNDGAGWQPFSSFADAAVLNGRAKKNGTLIADGNSVALQAYRLVVADGFVVLAVRATGSTSGQSIGGQTGFNRGLAADIGEIEIYSVSLTNAQIDTEISRLMTKWGIP